MSNADKYEAQKKYLSTKKQLRVWIDGEKFERFKKTTTENGDSIYGVINSCVDDYLKENEKE